MCWFLTFFICCCRRFYILLLLLAFFFSCFSPFISFLFSIFFSCSIFSADFVCLLHYYILCLVVYHLSSAQEEKKKYFFFLFAATFLNQRYNLQHEMPKRGKRSFRKTATQKMFHAFSTTFCFLSFFVDKFESVTTVSKGNVQHQKR